MIKQQPLTEHLKDSNSLVKQFLKQRFPRTARLTQKANLQLQSEDTINPGFKPKIYDLLATAIGYRIRYSFVITPNDELAESVGAWFFSFYWGGGPYLSHSGKLIKDFFDSLDDTLEAIVPVKQRLKDEQEKLLARYCYVLALFEQLCRDTASYLYSPLLIPRRKQSVDELLGIPTDAEVDDLCAMSWLFYDQYHDRLSLPTVLNPTFTRCGAVSESDADLIVDECLIEIKASIKPEIKPPSLWQLTGYLLLDSKDKYNIHSVGVYMARQGKLFQWSIADFLHRLTGESTISLVQLRQEFRILCQGM